METEKKAEEAERFKQVAHFLVQSPEYFVDRCGSLFARHLAYLRTHFSSSSDGVTQKSHCDLYYVVKRALVKKFRLIDIWCWRAYERAVVLGEQACDGPGLESVPEQQILLLRHFFGPNRVLRGLLALLYALPRACRKASKRSSGPFSGTVVVLSDQLTSGILTSEQFRSVFVGESPSDRDTAKLLEVCLTSIFVEVQWAYVVEWKTMWAHMQRDHPKYSEELKKSPTLVDCVRQWIPLDVRKLQGSRARSMLTAIDATAGFTQMCGRVTQLCMACGMFPLLARWYGSGSDTRIAGDLRNVIARAVLPSSDRDPPCAESWCSASQYTVCLRAVCDVMTDTPVPTGEGKYEKPDKAVSAVSLSSFAAGCLSSYSMALQVSRTPRLPPAMIPLCACNHDQHLQTDFDQGFDGQSYSLRDTVAYLFSDDRMERVCIRAGPDNETKDPERRGATAHFVTVDAQFVDSKTTWTPADIGNIMGDFVFSVLCLRLLDHEQAQASEHSAPRNPTIDRLIEDVLMGMEAVMGYVIKHVNLTPHFPLYLRRAMYSVERMVCGQGGGAFEQMLSGFGEGFGSRSETGRQLVGMHAHTLKKVLSPGAVVKVAEISQQLTAPAPTSTSEEAPDAQPSTPSPQESTEAQPESPVSDAADEHNTVGVHDETEQLPGIAARMRELIPERTQGTQVKLDVTRLRTRTLNRTRFFDSDRQPVGRLRVPTVVTNIHDKDSHEPPNPFQLDPQDSKETPKSTESGGVPQELESSEPASSLTPNSAGGPSPPSDDVEPQSHLNTDEKPTQCESKRPDFFAEWYSKMQMHHFRGLDDDTHWSSNEQLPTANDTRTSDISSLSPPHFKLTANGLLPPSAGDDGVPTGMLQRTDFTDLDFESMMGTTPDSIGLATEPDVHPDEKESAPSECKVPQQ